MPTTDLQRVGAKWRREVQPPRRLTAREQFLPWAMLSLPWHRSGVNHLTAGILAAAFACSRAVSTGFCPNGPRPGSVAPPVNGPPDTGDTGMPVNATGPPTTANNAAANRPDAIAAVGNSTRLAPSRRLFLPKSRPSTHRPLASHHPPPARPPQAPRPAWVSAQTEFRKKPGACPVTGQAATSFSSPLRVPLSNTSVPAAAAGRYDASSSAKPDSGGAAAAVAGRNAAFIADPRPRLPSRRHVWRIPRPEGYLSLAPKDRGGSGWAGRSGPPFPLSARGPL
jgi:hypothetical protein